MDEQTQMQKNLCIRILKYCKNELYRRYPFLDAICAGLIFRESAKITSCGTDGVYFYYSQQYLIESFREDPEYLLRVILHAMIHPLSGHILCKEESRPGWDLACDIAAEQILIRNFRFFPMSGEQEQSSDERTEEVIRRECLERIGSEAKSAEQILRMLEHHHFPYDELEIRNAFCIDDHRFWISVEKKEQAEEIRRKWERIRSHAEGGADSSGSGGSIGNTPGGEIETISLRKNGKNSYRNYLRRFAVSREEQSLDLDSFDPVFYHFGLQHYGNIPLIEPLEMREISRLEELVIAIDTSGSCSAETVERFLAETGRILQEKDNFFEDMNVCLIQCDCVIQKVTRIHSMEEWMRIGEHIEIHGRGGTDFRPVFRYIHSMQEQKEFRNLRALLYFTDGDGIYPEKPEGYETAVILSGKEDRPGVRIPGWVRIFHLET